MILTVNGIWTGGTLVPEKEQHDDDCVVATVVRSNEPKTMDGLFDALPQELLYWILLYLDICSLGKLTQVNKSSRLARMACSDESIWKNFVRKRFQIGRSVKPRSCGASTWKDSYLSLATSNRAPKCRLFASSRKAIFAKSASGYTSPRRKKQQQQLVPYYDVLPNTSWSDESCDDCYDDSSSHKNNNTMRMGMNCILVTNRQLGIWVRMSHTENCRTRIDHHRQCRYVELQVCLQNVQSSGEPMEVDISNSFMITRESFVNHPVLECPRLLHMHRSNPSQLNNEERGFAIESPLQLHPFDFVICSMCFACLEDVYETDFLSRALALNVPILSSNSHRHYKYNAASSQQHSIMAQATFLPEMEIWKHYVELPGGFLALADKSNPVNM